MSNTLKIGILSFVPLGKSASPSEKMLHKAAVRFGHKSRIYRSEHFQVIFDKQNPRLLYKSSVFRAPDVMIVRAHAHPSRNLDIDISIAKHLQLLNIPVVNRYLPIMRAKNKIRTLQILHHHGIPIPRTVMIHNLEYLDKAMDVIGKFPIIMKVPQGSQGIGVSIIESRRSLRSTVEMVTATTKNSLLIMQEYVKEAKGKDIRVLVIGGDIVAAMERRARKGEFRSNFHQGGSINPVDLTFEERKIARDSVKAIGLDVAGVDIIRTTEGPKILEVNANPGLEGITQATQKDVAGDILHFAESLIHHKKWLNRGDEMLTNA